MLNSSSLILIIFNLLFINIQPSRTICAPGYLWIENICFPQDIRCGNNGVYFNGICNIVYPGICNFGYLAVNNCCCPLKCFQTCIQDTLCSCCSSTLCPQMLCPTYDSNITSTLFNSTKIQTVSSNCQKTEYFKFGSECNPYQTSGSFLNAIPYNQQFYKLCYPAVQPHIPIYTTPIVSLSGSIYPPFPLVPPILEPPPISPPNIVPSIPSHPILTLSPSVSELKPDVSSPLPSLTYSTIQPTHITCPSGTVLIGGQCRLIYCSPGLALQNDRCVVIECPIGMKWIGTQCINIKPIEHNIVFNHTIVTTHYNTNETIRNIILNNVNNLQINASINISPIESLSDVYDDYHYNDVDEDGSDDYGENIENDIKDTMIVTSTEKSIKCCVVVSPRICKPQIGQNWTCYNRRQRLCGEFCIATTVFLRAPHLNYQYPYLIMPPMMKPNCYDSGVCPPPEYYFHCSGCVSGYMKECSPYCYRYQCAQRRHCSFYDQQQYCTQYDTSFGCRAIDGCYFNWCKFN